MTPEQLEKELKKIWKRICCNSGTSSFESLTDGPGEFAGHAGESVRVNGTEDALEYFAAAGSGTVTNFVFTDGNGVDGTVTTSTTIPTLSLAFTPVGILKSNGTTISAATAPDFPTLNQNTTGSAASLSANLPISRLNTGINASSTTFWRGDGVWEEVPNNLVVTGVGTGEPILYDLGTDVLYHRALLGTTFVDVSTVADDVVISLSATGSPDNTKFLRGDNTWAVPAGGGGGSGTVDLGTQFRLAYYASTGTVVSEGNAITGSRALVSDTNGVPVHASTTAAEIGFVNGVTSAIQTQINGKVNNTGTETISGTKTFSGTLIAGTFLSNTSVTNSNISWNSGSGAAIDTTQAEFLPSGSSGIVMRVGMRGNTGSVITAGRSYAALGIGQMIGIEAASGTHPLFASLMIKAPSITNGTATTTDAATLYIDGPPTGTATITNPVNSIWVLSGNTLMSNGSITLGTAGNKINIATGTNASVGVSAAMTAGTITISTTAVTASSKIFLTHASLGGTQGILSVGTITAGTSFVINSSNAADTGTVNWWIIN